MSVKLTNISDISEELVSGYSFRGKIRNNSRGDLFVINLKDIENNYTQIGTNLTKIRRDEVDDKYWLQPGDLLFISKGEYNNAIVFDLGISPVVATSAFFVIRPDQSKVLPHYLAWYINQPKAQVYLKRYRAGSTVQVIAKKVLAEMEIELPSFKVQQSIVEFYTLARAEGEIMKMIKEKREQLTSELLTNMINITNGK